jgi:hypothetical protein
MRRTADSPVLRVVPLILLALVVALESGVRTTELLRERTRLGEIRAGQDEAVKNADFRRSDFDKLVTATVNLANGGDANVRPVVEELKRLGAVSLNP